MFKRQRITPQKYNREEYVRKISFPNRLSEQDLPPKKRLCNRSYLIVNDKEGKSKVITEAADQKQDDLPCIQAKTELVVKKGKSKVITEAACQKQDDLPCIKAKTELVVKKDKSKVITEAACQKQDDLPCIQAKTELKVKEGKSKVITEATDQKQDDLPCIQAKTEFEMKEFTFFIEWQNWKEIRPEGCLPTGKRRLSGKWTDIFATEINTILPGCVLRFFTNKVKKSLSRKKKSVFFNGKAECKRAECGGQFIFKIIEEPNTDENVEVLCIASGTFYHNPEVPERRQIRGIQRQLTGDKIQNEGSAVKFYYKQVEEAPEEQLETGNYTQTQQQPVLRKILQEQVAKETLHHNIVQEALLLKEAFEAEDASENSSLRGYIQYVGAFPFSVALYSREQISLMRSLAAEGRLNLYFDATGSVVNKIPNQKRHLLYSLVVKPVETLPPISVADLLTTGHSIPDLVYFLSHIKRAFVLTGKSFAINKIETDWSWALIQASLQVFNRKDTKEYLTECWKILHGEYTTEHLNEFTVLHLCCAHMIKDFVKSIAKEVLKKKAVRVFSMKCFALLQNTTSLLTARRLFGCMCSVMGQKHFSIDVSRAQKSMEMEMKGLEMEALTDVDAKDEETKELRTLCESHTNNATIKDASPFTTYFSGIFCSITQDTEAEIGTFNPLYCPEILKILVEKFFPIFPLWSGVMLQDLVRYSTGNRNEGTAQQTEGPTRDTNACVEGWFKSLKVDTLRKCRLRTGKFICTLRKMTKVRLKELKYPAIRSNAKKLKQKSKLEGQEALDIPLKKIQLAEDGWKRSGTTKSSKQTLKLSKSTNEVQKFTPGKPAEVPRWGGTLGTPGSETYVNLLNTCPIDNGLTILHLAFQEDQLFQGYLKDEGATGSDTLYVCLQMMGRGNFTEAKVHWLEYVRGGKLSGSVNCWGSEWDMFASHINGLLHSKLSSYCENITCPRPVRERSRCLGIHLSIPKDRVGPYSLQSLVDSWRSPPRSECRAKRPFELMGMSYNETVKEIGEDGSEKEREYSFCSGTRCHKRTITSYPPVVVLPLSDLILGEGQPELVSQESLEQNLVIDTEEYRVCGLTYHGHGHFTCAVRTIHHGWLFYDGLSKGIKKITSIDAYKRVIESVYLVRVTNTLPDLI